MGNFNRNNPGAGKRKFDEREERARIRPSITQRILLGIILMAAVLFFISSYGYTVSVEFFFRGAWQGILIILAILLVAVSVWDKRVKVDQRKKKKKLMKAFSKQKKILQNRFDLQKSLASSLQSSLNFAADYEEKSEKADTSEEYASAPDRVESPSEEQSTKLDYIKDSQINLARIIIEGEDISTFPPEWQKFFVENEGKEPIEKLNAILKNGQNKTRD